MKKLLLLSALVIFSCSGGDDNSNTSNNNNCIEGRWDLVSRTVDGFQRFLSDCEQQKYIEITNENIIFESEDNITILFPQSIRIFDYAIEDSNCLEGITSSQSNPPIFLNATSAPNTFNILQYLDPSFFEFDPILAGMGGLVIINTAICNDNTLTIYQQNFFLDGENLNDETFDQETFEVYVRN